MGRGTASHAPPALSGVGSLGSAMLARADLSLWRWFFFGVTLIVVMILRPEGLWPSAQRAAELHTDEETA